MQESDVPTKADEKCTMGVGCRPIGSTCSRIALEQIASYRLGQLARRALLKLACQQTIVL